MVFQSRGVYKLSRDVICKLHTKHIPHAPTYSDLIENKTIFTIQCRVQIRSYMSERYVHCIWGAGYYIEIVSRS